MNQQKRIRWPVRWSETEEGQIIEAARQKDICPTQFIRTSSINKALSLQNTTRETPHTDEQKLRRKIFDYKIVDGWLDVASSLQETAEILKSSRSQYSNYPDIIWHELMVWGFCLENLLKGLYSKKQTAGLLKDRQAKPLNEEGELSSKKRDHNLEKWCQRAEVSNFNSTEQKRILKNLTQIILHHGRYPIPIKWTQSEGIYWDSSQHDHMLMEMINFLRQEIVKIE